MCPLNGPVEIPVVELINLGLYFPGESSITEFSLCCTGWEEWEPLDPNSKLKYEFHIRHPGSPRTFTVSFGAECTPYPVVFPVGSVPHDFDLELINMIFDSVGDKYEYISTVKVRFQSFNIQTI